MKEKLLKAFFKSLAPLGLFLLFASLSASAQDRTVTGTITDDKDQGLPGASITVKGSAKGSNADANGKFSISGVKDSDILVISSIGFLRQEITVGNRSTVDVKLAPDVANLQEVTVTALGIKKDTRKLGYSTTTVEAVAINQARETNVVNSLQGRVAGLNISPASGGPASSSRINLRGVSNFKGGSPLFVINGVPMDNTSRGTSGEWGGADNGDGIGNINPDDIESMTVLKGASAAALYGTRAANGVILITTKSGKQNGGLSVEFNTNTQFDKVIDYTDFQYEYGQGQQGKRPTDVNSAKNSGIYSWGEKMDGQPYTQFDGKQYPYSPVKDNFENFYRTGSTYTNTVAVSGGGERNSFRLSLSNMNANAVLRSSGVNRKTINMSLTQKVTDKLDVSVMGNYVDQVDRNRAMLSDAPMNANYGIMFLATSFNQKALMPGYDPITGAEMTFSDDTYKTNPWFVVNQYKNEISRKRLITAITSKYQFADWIYLQGRIGYDLINDGGFNITPWGTAYSSKGGVGNSKSQTTEMNIDGLLGVNKTFGDFGVNVALGANLRKNKAESVSVSGGQLSIPYLYTLSNTLTKGQGYGYNERQVQSGYYTADFDYKGFLTLSTTGRYDIYSTLPSSNRGIFAPSVSGAFIFSELMNSSFLDFGKLRASYAQTSGEAFDAYLTSQYYSLGNTYNGLPQGGFGSQLPNINLKPYRLKEFEIGFETKFLHNRLGLDVAYFNRTTKDEIVNGPLSPTTGYTSQVLNLGSTKNHGIEILLTGTPVQTTSFKWDMSFNLTSVKNTIADIDGLNADGTPKTKVFGLGTYRPLNANIAHVRGLPAAQIMAYDYKYNANGQMIIGSDGIPVRGELKPMGSSLPKVYGGFNNSLNYKALTLSFLFDYKFGGKVLSATNHYSIVDGLNKMTLVGRETGIVADGVLETGEANTQNISAQTYYSKLVTNISKLNVFSSDFIKLRQVVLSYNLPANWFNNKLPFEGISVSAVGRNLATLLMHTKNFDPEAGFSSNVSYAGTEGSQYPSTRTYGFTVNARFKK
ncbi:SusC/RagA family TonB-linked outer membrane protein [Dyadobacter sandarakinus]|uniref:SusC/RagA family TonB-linked outer membrane protein n=1 Tax=Dyadobacter sandarakinus TaxID=2747268 RepID=A0ABX7I7C3_9BACT|nr:SusC/RagA family TonB-linked outer membrane protein [Dyadobacter sandarakinus]QRR01785.1 SusC/RagA family TonB-linked outer membrane protein [Dyadobacter sandarakinus]